MNVIRRIGKSLVVGSALGALVLGALALTAPRADAKPPIGPLCGPSYLWECTGPGGPTVLFPGTVCDKIVFERRTGLTCKPYGG